MRRPRGRCDRRLRCGRLLRAPFPGPAQETGEPQARSAERSSSGGGSGSGGELELEWRLTSAAAVRLRGGGGTSRAQPIAGLFTTGVDSERNAAPDRLDRPALHLHEHGSQPRRSRRRRRPRRKQSAPNMGAQHEHLGLISPEANAWSATDDLFTYTTSFTLTGVDPTTASLSGTWACDDSCTMSLNGTQVASNAAPAWTDVRSFAIPAGSPFQPGANTLTIVVPNSGGNVTGLQILTIAGTASPVTTGGPPAASSTTIIDPHGNERMSTSSRRRSRTRTSSTTRRTPTRYTTRTTRPPGPRSPGRRRRRGTA